MIFTIGVILFALGILVSVCLHEAGHLVTAKRFGMKATQYFAGFGPTLWSFRRGETEYGLKAIPAGGFVKIVGMTPLDDVDPADEPRAFWRAPIGKRTVVLAAGSVTHFLLAFLLLYGTALVAGLPDLSLRDYDTAKGPATIGEVSNCIVQTWEAGSSGGLRDCKVGDPEAPAKAAGLQAGDRITSIDGTPGDNYGEIQQLIREAPAGTPVPITFIRDGVTQTVQVTLVPAQRPPVDDPSGDAVEVSALGVAPQLPDPVIQYGPVTAIGGAANFFGNMVQQTFASIAKFPEKVPKLLDALNGQPRDPETPVSVVGASRIGGQAFELGSGLTFVMVLAGLNIFIGIFNLFPLLPLDGGHIAIIWFEKVRSWWAGVRGRPDPGRVDYNKLLPVTYLVILVFGGLTLLTLAADIVNPISL